MKQVLSTILAIALLLGLGALAVLALPGAQVALNTVQAAPIELAAPVQQEDSASPASIDYTVAWNTIALPLEAADVGVDSADDVSAYIESFCDDPGCPDGIPQVAYWDATYQTLSIRSVGGIYPLDFAVSTGDSLFVAVADPTAFTASSFAWVGGVPPKCADDPTNCVSHTLVATGWNFIMIPLEKDTIAWADDLAADIDPNVTQVAYWDADYQTLSIRSVGGIYPLDFPVKAGYPYFIYANGITNTVWP